MICHLTTQKISFKKNTTVPGKRRDAVAHFAVNSLF
jgi:hypothetical protein